MNNRLLRQYEITLNPQKIGKMYTIQFRVTGTQKDKIMKLVDKLAYKNAGQLIVHFMEQVYEHEFNGTLE